MSVSDVVFGLGVLAVLAFQVWLTVRVVKNPVFDRAQKSAQTKLIWLLPVVGAVLVFSLMPEDVDSRPRMSERR